MKTLLGAIACALTLSSISRFSLAAQTGPDACQQSGRHCGRHQACAGVPRLKVVGTRLLNEKGDSVVLNGPSLGWHSNWGRFYNDSTVMAFRRNWDANITRAAIGAHTSGDVVNCFDASSNAMHWTDAQLKPWAKMARATIKRRNAPAPAKSK